MALPSTGIISLDMIRKEIRKDGMITLNDPECRLLADKESDTIKFSDFYGKQYWYRIKIIRNDNQNIISNEEIIKKSNYDFSKFYNYETSDNKFISELIDEDTEERIDFTSISINKDYNIRAVMKDKSFTVSFNTNGGTPTYPDQTIIYNEKVVKPSTTPSKLGYSFSKWVKNNENVAYNFETPVTESFTLNAIYIEKYYTVNFESNGGSTINSKTVREGENLQAPTNPTKVGHTFGGWYTNSELTNKYDFNTPVMNDLTLYAKWIINTYVIKFQSNTNESIYEDITLDYNSLIPEPTPKPTKEGYNFDGWYLDSEFNNKIDFNTYRVTSNITLYGKWSIKQFDFWIFPNNGIEDIESNYIKRKVNYGGTVARPENPVHNESNKYVFKYWSETNPNTSTPKEYNFETKVYKNYLLYGYFDLKTFTIKYYNGDSLYLTDTKKYGEKAIDKSIELPEGYESVFWSEDKVNRYDFNTPITKDLNLYAIFKKKVFTVTFNTNGGNPNNIPVQYIEYGNKASKPQDPTLVNNQFLGWFEDDTTQVSFDFNTLIKKNYTLKARWKKTHAIIKFIASDTKESLLTKTVSLNSNYTLSIWDTSSDREDYLPVTSNGGPVGFIIDDGELSPKGDKKWIFNRVITEDTTIEVEMMRFDYYFTSSYNLKLKVDTILNENNNDLSSKSIGFSDIVTDTNSIFTDKTNLLKTPKYMYGRRIKSSYSTFSGCNNLNKISETLFENYPRVEDFASLFSFSDNNSLTEISPYLFTNCLNITSLRSALKSCKLITNIPSGFLKNNTKLKDIAFLFSNWSKLESVPDDLIYNCKSITNFESTFYYCENLLGISENFFKNITNIAENNFNSTFSNCGNIKTKIPELWNSHNKSTKHYNYAKNCKKSSNYEIIPEDWGGPIYYTLSFNVGEFAQPIEDIKVMEGKVITAPEVIVNEGYEFKGWYDDSEFTYPTDFSYPVFTDWTFYAKIVEDTSNFTYENNLVFLIGDGPNGNAAKAIFKNESDRKIQINNEVFEFSEIYLDSHETGFSFLIILKNNVIDKFTIFESATIEIEGITDSKRKANGKFTLDLFYSSIGFKGTYLWDINASIGGGDFMSWWNLFLLPDTSSLPIEYTYKLKILFNKK